MKYLILALALCACAPSYNEFNVATLPYTKANSAYASADAGMSVNILVLLGYEIEHASRKRVVTKWEQFYHNNGTQWATEFQTRIVVDIEHGKLKAQCTQRLIQGKWHFKKCTSPSVLKRLRTAIKELQSHLPLFD